MFDIGSEFLESATGEMLVGYNAPPCVEDVELDVLLIDGDFLFTQMMSAFLGHEGIRSKSAFNGKRGVDAALSGVYDAVLLNTNLPDANGLDVLRDIRRSSMIPVIMLLPEDRHSDGIAGLDMGADDFLTRSYFSRELVVRLRNVTRRPRGYGAVPRRTVQGGGELELDQGSREVLWRGAPFAVTTAEFGILGRLMQAKSDVVRKTDMSISVLGRPLAAHDRSLDVHVSNLRRKLADATQGQVQIKTVRKIGYALNACGG